MSPITDQLEEEERRRGGQDHFKFTDGQNHPIDHLLKEWSTFSLTKFKFEFVLTHFLAFLLAKKMLGHKYK